ncbi:putative transcription initiation factor TFIID [Wickerhamomyces ciferrii]|uniref:Transcription initiation factor TFIID n=1 Tax=Wickerhamomyces ciferrii (strain ATCC 14091 / BCRC 22168 / CBS 111 / JCM 3599 / NBRC 0793 / NRRL Y-1031 F-60-10) TaxID=1206466 RepID=K0KXM6_WICCF|nr:putative transcription initiation factor TFIID [Wickerhamomyces ciferrii]CCH46777.1 putative transcription initiation factor TFIID [Wickerhamomyces ciferrii]
MASQKKDQGALRNEEDDFNALLKGSDMGSFDIGKLIGKGDMNTEHADNAIDYEDIDELADDDLPEEEEPSNGNTNGNGGAAAGDDDGDDFMKDLEVEAKGTNDNDNDSQFDRLFGDKIDDGFGGDQGFEDTEEDIQKAKQAEEAKKKKKLEELEKQKKIKEQEDQEQLKFQERLLKFYYPSFKKNSILKMNSIFGPKPQNYEYHKPGYPKPLLPTKVNLEVETDDRRIFKSNLNHNTRNDTKRIIPIEDDIFEDQVTKKKTKVELDEDLMLSTFEWDYKKIVGDSSENEILNEKQNGNLNQKDITLKEQIERFNYFDEEDYDDDAILEGQLATKLQLDMNDPNLLFLDDRNVSQHKVSRKPLIPAIPTNEKLLAAKFNVSNDQNYDQLKENYHSKIRSTIGNMAIEHSQPALRLQSPYYKVKLTKDQLRNFHKKDFKVRPGHVMQFSKLKQRKRKKDRGKDIKELFAKTTDLSLGDTGQTLLMEHSEQVPIVLPNFGMGSKLLNYYRKKDEEDTSRPKLAIGETHVLGVQDKSPFWNFGFVEPGNIVPTLYNKLTRAPVFKHEAKSTDFLLIKSTGGGISQKYFLKSINNLFVVGQLFPVVDIPGPHSRKVTTASKNRLKMIVFRVLKRSPERRLLVRDISIHFPDQNDMQNRQRLKEFMEYQRSGDDQGFWKLKEELPSDRLISPEDLTLLEAMQVAQQHMEDLEFYSNEDINDELALWNLSKNFINATQGKAMLQLSGDPEGKAFSFMKTSMKGGFKSFESNGHSYNVALQQKAYDEEISRTWYNQQKKLTEISSNVDEDEGNSEDLNKKEESIKFLKITRRVRDKNGILQRKHEIIKDQNVIRAYIKRREKLEEDIIPDDITLTNDEEKNQKNKKLLEEQLAKLQKNQERRNARKVSKENMGGKGIGKGKSTARRCQNCGGIGHIRTNKACPMYDESNP